jgi:hypothetical protein
VFSTKINHHGSRRGDVMQALAQWQHPVAVELRVKPTSHHHTPLTIRITSNSPKFVVVVDSLFAQNVS